MPYSYGFENNNLATDGWTTSNTSGLNDSEFGISSYASTGSYGFCFSSYDDEGENTQYLISPQLSAATGVVVQFYYRASSDYGDETFKVGYSTTDASPSSFTFGSEISTNNTSWTLSEEFNFPAGTKYVAIYYYADYQYRLYVDDITFTAPTSCAKPTALAASSITATGATLTWTAGGTETDWTVEYGTAADFTGAASQNVTTPTLALTGLNPATTYYVRVKAVCGVGDESNWSNPVSFATSCVAITAAGYTQNFDALTAGNNVLPLCWSYINTTTYSYYQGYPKAYADGYSTYSHSPSNCLYFYTYNYSSYDPQPQYAILPEMTGLAGKQVTLWAKGSNATSTFKIGTMSDPADASTFTLIAEQTLTTSYQEFAYLVPSTTDAYLAIMMDPSSSSSGSSVGFYIDDISIAEPPSCLKPTDVTCSATTTTTATLSWTETGTATAWQICLDGDEANPIDAATNPFTLTGLTSATTYTVKVRANCGANGYSDWSSSTVNVTTKCEALTAFPWTENFDALTVNNSIPTCWNNDDGTTTSASYKWCYNTSTSGNGATSGTGHSGNCIRFDSYSNSSNNTNFLKTIPLSLPASPVMQLSFWYKNPAGGDFSVYISTDGGATYTTSLATGLTGASSWTRIDPILLDAYAGQDVVIVFKGTSNWGSGDAYIYLDDVTVEEAPACLPVSALSVTATTTTTATLAWTETGTATQWQVSVDDGTPTLVSTNPYTLTGLTPATTYAVKVRAYCASDDQSEWSSPVNVTTKCEAITSLPWSENFESYASGDFTATCWTNEHISGTGTQIFKVYTSTNGSNSTHQLQLPDMSNGTQTKLVLPGMTLPSSNYKFSIDVYRNTSSSSYTSEGVRVYASADGEIAGATELGFLYRNYTQTDGGVVTAETASGWYTYVFPIPFSGSCYIILRGESQYGSATYMDNFQVLACTAPTGLAYSELKSDRVDLSWTSDADRWDVSTGDDDHPIELTSSDVTIDGTTITYRLKGLDPEHAYTVKVRNNCSSDGVSEWSSTVSFTTLADCGRPENVTVSNVGAHVADVAWTGNGEEFSVWYRTAAAVDGTVEEFATSSLPTGWENKSGLLSSVMSGTALSTASGWITNSYALGTYNVKANIFGTSCNKWLIAPATTLPASAVMSFDVALTAFSSAGAAATTGTDDRFVVLISTDNMATWTILREWNNSGSTYVYNDIATAGENVNIDLSAYATQNVRIAFYGESTVSNADNDLHIDNVAIGTPVAAGTWEKVDITTAPAQTSLESLRDGTTYELKVTPACDESAESDIASFTTLALPTFNVTANKWYALSSPMHNSGVNETVTGVANLTSGTYDFLRYDEPSSTWESQKSGAGHTGFSTLEPGRGYIYRRANDAVLEVDGEPNTGNVNVAITKDADGWNLIGNPFMVPIRFNSTYMVDASAALNTSGFYTLSTNGTWTAVSSYYFSSTDIAAGQAVLVKANTAGTLTLRKSASKSAASGEENGQGFVFSLSNDVYSDVAYAMFADGEGLPKISHLNPEAPMLSIDGYAIAMMEQGVERFPLSVSGQGKYTLALKENSADATYLHLIDRATGRDIDLLATPEYTFTANGQADRFEVRLMPGMDENGNVNFVYIDGTRLIVDGEGELQVFDVMGRQLGSAQVAGTATLDRSALGIVSAGVYVVRLGGNSQKIVVK